MVGFLPNLVDIPVHTQTQPCFDGARYNGALPAASDVESHTVEQNVPRFSLTVGCHKMVELSLQAWNAAALTKLIDNLSS